MILSHARLPVPTLPRVRNSPLMSTGFVKSSQKSSQSSQIQEWIKAFIASRPSGTSPNTISFYHMTLNRLIGYSLSPDSISKFLAELSCGNGKRNYYVAVRALCNWLYKNGHITENPISHVPRPKTRRRLLSSPAEKDVDRIINSVGLLRDKCLV
jgi:site-specific recombinase XerD